MPCSDLDGLLERFTDLEDAERVRQDCVARRRQRWLPILDV